MKLYWYDILLKNMLPRLMHTIKRMTKSWIQHMQGPIHTVYNTATHLHACTIKNHHVSSVGTCGCTVQILQQMKGQWKYILAQSAECGVHWKRQGEHTHTHTPEHNHSHIYKKQPQTADARHAKTDAYRKQISSVYHTTKWQRQTHAQTHMGAHIQKHQPPWLRHWDQLGCQGQCIIWGSQLSVGCPDVAVLLCRPSAPGGLGQIWHTKPISPLLSLKKQEACNKQQVNWLAHATISVPFPHLNH